MANMNNQNNVYTLTKTQLKNGKFHYVVTDQNGNIISDRKSARDYVACTIDGSYYFGRLDLVGKGDHARRIKDLHYWLNITEKEFTSIKIFVGTHAEFIKLKQSRLVMLNSIAYLK